MANVFTLLQLCATLLISAAAWRADSVGASADPFFDETPGHVQTTKFEESSFDKIAAFLSALDTAEKEDTDSEGSGRGLAEYSYGYTSAPTPAPSITCPTDTSVYRLYMSDLGLDGWQARRARSATVMVTH